MFWDNWTKEALYGPRFKKITVLLYRERVILIRHATRDGFDNTMV
jgi:hypothetical protein